MISFALGETRKFTFTGSMAEAVLRSFEHYKSLKEAEFQGSSANPEGIVAMTGKIKLCMSLRSIP